MAEPLNYSSYLRLDELLSLQTPRSDGPQGPEHDEMLFIVVHQAYELWFKQILHEMSRMQDLLARDDTVRVRHTMKRVLTILKVLVAQIDILETMTPLEFLTFRDRLEEGRMHGAVRTWAIRSGVVGHIARGGVFAIIGIFLGKAAIEYDPDEAVGIDGALLKLVEQPYGKVLLGLVAAGLVAYALFCLVEARYRRIEPAHG